MTLQTPFYRRVEANVAPGRTQRRLISLVGHGDVGPVAEIIKKLGDQCVPLATHSAQAFGINNDTIATDPNARKGVGFSPEGDIVKEAAALSKTVWAYRA